MSKVTSHMTMSVDGVTAGHDQSLEHPFGERVGERLHRWMFEEPDASANARAREVITEAGAFVMGRNMFTPGRGEWDPDWRGWWGDDPPYHAPVFVVTHHPREAIEMQGGTTYHFVTDGIEAAVARAREAAGERNVCVLGGAQTVNQALGAGLIDEMHLHIAPIVIGSGGRLFDGVGDLALEQVGEPWGTKLVTHVTYRVGR
jgi:dihydrofolate reductase